MNFNYDRKMGVEIECYNVHHKDLEEALLDKGLKVQNRFSDYDSEQAAWVITEDGSIDRGNSIELVSPILQGVEGFRQVEIVCHVLNKLGAKIAKTCGLHVHVDANDLTGNDLYNLVQRYYKYECTIDGWMPESRRENNNEFCYSVEELAGFLNQAEGRTAYLQTINYESSHGRYYKLNLLAFFRHGTVEFRHHSGTINAQKIINWMIFCVTFVETTKALGKNADVFENIPEEVIAFYKNRTRMLQA